MFVGLRWCLAGVGLCGCVCTHVCVCCACVCLEGERGGVTKRGINVLSPKWVRRFPPGDSVGCFVDVVWVLICLIVAPVACLCHCRHRSQRQAEEENEEIFREHAAKVLGRDVPRHSVEIAEMRLSMI